MSRQTVATAYFTAIVRSNPLHRCACTDSLSRTALFLQELPYGEVSATGRCALPLKRLQYEF